MYPFCFAVALLPPRTSVVHDSHLEPRAPPDCSIPVAVAQEDNINAPHSFTAVTNVPAHICCRNKMRRHGCGCSPRHTETRHRNSSNLFATNLARNSTFDTCVDLRRGHPVGEGIKPPCQRNNGVSSCSRGKSIVWGGDSAGFESVSRPREVASDLQNTPEQSVNIHALH